MNKLANQKINFKQKYKKAKIITWIWFSLSAILAVVGIILFTIWLMQLPNGDNYKKSNVPMYIYCALLGIGFLSMFVSIYFVVYYGKLSKGVPKDQAKRIALTAATSVASSSGSSLSSTGDKLRDTSSRIKTGM